MELDLINGLKMFWGLLKEKKYFFLFSCDIKNAPSKKINW